MHLLEDLDLELCRWYSAEAMEPVTIARHTSRYGFFENTEDYQLLNFLQPLLSFSCYFLKSTGMILLAIYGPCTLSTRAGKIVLNNVLWSKYSSTRNGQYYGYIRWGG